MTNVVFPSSMKLQTIVELGEALGFEVRLQGFEIHYVDNDSNKKSEPCRMKRASTNYQMKDK